MPLFIILNMALVVLSWMIIARVMLSWIRHDPRNPVIRFIYEVTEPILAPCRRIFPPRPGMPIDFSPFIALLIIQLLSKFIINMYR